MPQDNTLGDYFIIGTEKETDSVAQEAVDWFSTCTKEELEASLRDPELDVAKKKMTADSDNKEE